MKSLKHHSGNRAIPVFIGVILLMITVIQFSCKKDKGNKGQQIVPDYSDNYKHYPTVDGYEWDYEITQSDSVAVMNTFMLRSRYSTDSGTMNNFRNGVLWSFAYWSNSGNKLICCDGRVLVNYNNLLCSGDSLNIYEKKTATTETVIYQHCKKHKTDISGYTEIDCIKTLQFNKNLSSGTMLRIITYYGYGIGVIFREECGINAKGRVYYREIQRLKAHRF